MNDETTTNADDQLAAGGEATAAATADGGIRPAAERRTTLDVGLVSNLSSDNGTPSVPPADSGQVENLSYVLDRITSHPDLPPAMRERLAKLVQRQPPEEGPAKIALDDVLAILAEAVPSALRLAAGELPIAPHPEGEAFFTGDPASDAERQAAAVANEQLALSGLLRKP